MIGDRATVRPQSLPYCAYPNAANIKQHGVQHLSGVLPTADFTAMRPYRSIEFRPVTAATLEPAQLLDMARLVATAFAKREPMSRHLCPPKYPPQGLMEVIHSDAFGCDSFGPWTKGNIIYWFIRLFLLTDPTTPASNIQLNDDVLRQSIAVLNQGREIMAVSFNETLPMLDEQPPLRQDDPFISAVFMYLQTIFGLLSDQDAAALQALYAHFPEFQDAHRRGKVGHQVMCARSDVMPTEDTFEIVAAALENYRELGYEYITTEATNQWTGAAFEAVGAVRVHFAPFRAGKKVCQSPVPLADVVTSLDGFIADKDSGSMFYVLRL